MVVKPEYLIRKPKKSACQGCPLYKAHHVNSWLVPTTYWPNYKGQVRIVFVAEAPGKKEDEVNETLVGPTGIGPTTCHR